MVCRLAIYYTPTLVHYLRHFDATHPKVINSAAVGTNTHNPRSMPATKLPLLYQRIAPTIKAVSGRK
jgi:hypothetical protein